ncbi:Son of sevenless 1, variant 3 [Cymbomonas tetramitiformis]|uniref:Son of sevenless 1, variant 3 n=1 Tax=Cymbomonas tetramitiformis TaxID=36881 RepID=A0AAE0GBV5_9CHLO|nr:Son of sevenless 1, variant 3 [Cymbomonas tetramitiformis]
MPTMYHRRPHYAPLDTVAWLLLLTVISATCDVIAASASKQDSDSHEGEEDAHSSHDSRVHYVAILFLFVALAMGALCRTLLVNTKVPYTVALLVIGLIIGAVNEFVDMKVLKESIDQWKGIDPHLLLFAFLPGLVFESAFSLEWHTFKKCLSQVFILATIGVAMGTSLIGLFVVYVFPYDWSLEFGMMAGAILCATDPVAVVALLKELGADKKLGTVIEGESLMNDGTAIVFFSLFLDLAKGESKTVSEIIVFFIQVPFVGPLIGVAFGWATLQWLGYVYNDALVDISLTLISCYLTFFVSELAGSSGVLSVVAFGAYLSAYGKPYFSCKKEVEETLHHFWAMMTYIANTIIFILAGLIVGSHSKAFSEDLKGTDALWLFVLYIYLIVTRFLTIGVLFPWLQRIGYSLDYANASIMAWGGLRGAVGLALGMIVYEEPAFSSRDQMLVIFHVGGIVILTLLINGSTTGTLLHYLGLDVGAANKQEVLASVHAEMSDMVLTTYLDTFCDSTLGTADYTQVKQYVSALSRDLNEETKARISFFGKQAAGKQMSTSKPQDPRKKPEGKVQGKLTKVKSVISVEKVDDVRKRYLEIVKQGYWEMLEHGQLRKKMALLLVETVDKALDHRHESIRDWEFLQEELEKGKLNLSWVKSFPLPTSLRKYLVDTIALQRNARDVSAAVSFYAAHTHATSCLKERFETVNTAAVMKEALAACTQAERVIQEAKLCSPEVVQIIKTQEVIRTLLYKQQSFVEKVALSGLLDDNECSSLVQEVERDMKRFAISPPEPVQPSVEQVLGCSPLVDSLKSEALRLALIGHAQLISLTANQVLFREGSREDVMYLVGRGVVSISQSDSLREEPSADDGEDVSAVKRKKGGKATKDTRIRIGSHSHPCGWAFGTYEVLKHGEGELAPKRQYTVKADTLCMVFSVSGPFLRSFMREEAETARKVWCSSAGILLETTLRADLEEAMTIFNASHSATLTKAKLMQEIMNGEVATVNGGELFSDCEQLTVLLEGCVYNEADGTIHAPAVLGIHWEVDENSLIPGGDTLIFQENGLVKSRSNSDVFGMASRRRSITVDGFDSSTEHETAQTVETGNQPMTKSSQDTTYHVAEFARVLTVDFPKPSVQTVRHTVAQGMALKLQGSILAAVFEDKSRTVVAGDGSEAAGQHPCGSF